MCCRDAEVSFLPPLNWPCSPVVRQNQERFHFRLPIVENARERAVNFEFGRGQREAWAAIWRAGIDLKTRGFPKLQLFRIVKAIHGRSIQAATA